MASAGAAPSLARSFAQPSGGGAGGGSGGGGSAGSDVGGDADAEAHPAPTMGEIKHLLTTILHHLRPMVVLELLIYIRLTTMMGNSGFASGLDRSMAAVVTGTPADKDPVKRMKGLLASMCSIADKLPMFCGPVFLWLLTNSGQNFDNPWMQVISIGSLVMCFISFILLAFTSKFKDSESIDGVLFKIFMWLLLPVFFALWPGLCMILHFYVHTSKFILWPLGALFSVLSVSFWFWGFYKEHQKILEELKGGCVPENDMLTENPDSEAAPAQGLPLADPHNVQMPIDQTGIYPFQVKSGGSPYRGVARGNWGAKSNTILPQ